MIKSFYGRKVTNFLEESQPFLDQEIQAILAQQIEQLTNKEIEILKVLAQEKKQLSLSKLKSLVNIKSTDLLNNIQSLQRRNRLSLQTIENQIICEISVILREYLLKK